MPLLCGFHFFFSGRKVVRTSGTHPCANEGNGTNQ
jgi:hypothetical protein